MLDNNHSVNFILAMVIDVISFTALFTEIDLLLKFFVAVTALAYTLWKWRAEYIDRKNKPK